MKLCPSECERYTQCFALIMEDIGSGLYVFAVPMLIASFLVFLRWVIGAAKEMQ